jgi:hypothetical protein
LYGVDFYKDHVQIITDSAILRVPRQHTRSGIKLAARDVDVCRDEEIGI